MKRLIALVGPLLTAAPLAAQPAPLDVPDVPPRLSLIRSSAPDASSRVTITGVAGAVPASATVFLINMDTGHFAEVRAGAGGAFSGSVFAPYGSSILLRTDTRAPPGLAGGPTVGPGTILRIPERYTTQFVLFVGTGAQASTGTLRFYRQSGLPLELMVR